jgi:hypothetical protein
MRLDTPLHPPPNGCAISCVIENIKSSLKRTRDCTDDPELAIELQNDGIAKVRRQELHGTGLFDDDSLQQSARGRSRQQPVASTMSRGRGRGRSTSNAIPSRQTTPGGSQYSRHTTPAASRSRTVSPFPSRASESEQYVLNGVVVTHEIPLEKRAELERMASATKLVNQDCRDAEGACSAVDSDVSATHTRLAIMDCTAAAVDARSDDGNVVRYSDVVNQVDPRLADVVAGMRQKVEAGLNSLASARAMLDQLKDYYTFKKVPMYEFNRLVKRVDSRLTPVMDRAHDDAPPWFHEELEKLRECQRVLHALVPVIKVTSCNKVLRYPEVLEAMVDAYRSFPYDFPDAFITDVFKLQADYFSANKQIEKLSVPLHLPSVPLYAPVRSPNSPL